MLRPLEGEGVAQRSLGVGLTAAPQGPPRMLRPLEGEGVAQRSLGVGLSCYSSGCHWPSTKPSIGWKLIL